MHVAAHLQQETKHLKRQMQQGHEPTAPPRKVNLPRKQPDPMFCTRPVLGYQAIDTEADKKDAVAAGIIRN